MSFFLSALPAVPLLDLVFAISALSTNANEKFEKMKDVIKTMHNEYGKERIHYALIVFGKAPSVKLRLSKVFDTDDEFNSLLDFSGRATDGADLHKALQKAAELFQESEREDARKVSKVQQ